MARPQKEGLDYFPLDVDMCQDDKIYILEVECGLEGFGLLIKLLMKIYKEGYYIKWDNKVAKIFAHKNSVDVNVINNLIETALSNDLFNNKLYEEFNILTSKGIQKRYFKATSRRKEVEYKKEYNLINVNNYNNLVEVNEVNVNNNPKSVNDNVDKSTQSKEQNSKEKVKDKKEKELNTHADEIQRVYDCWIDNLSDVNNAQLTKKQKKTILTKIKKWSVNNLIAAIENYNEVYRSDYYYSHSFTMYTFIKQGNGAPRFLEGLDDKHDGDIWKDYKNDSDTTDTMKGVKYAN